MEWWYYLLIAFSIMWVLWGFFRKYEKINDENKALLKQISENVSEIQNILSIVHRREIKAKREFYERAEKGEVFPEEWDAEGYGS